MKADCGISTLPNWRIRFLPSFCFSRSFVFAVRLPGWVRQGPHAVALLAQRQDRPEMGVGLRWTASDEAPRVEGIA
jgi:hypothetical protein